MRENCKRIRTLGWLLTGWLTLMAGPAWAQVCGLPPSGAIGWWPGDGNAKDIVGNNDGLLQGNTSFTAAEVSQGFTFGSDTDAVTIPNKANLNVQSPGFTAEFWMKGIKNQPQPLFLVVDKSHGWTDSAGWAFQGDSVTGRVNFFIGAGGSGSTNFVGPSSVPDVLDGNFHHIAGVWDGASVLTYVDGVLQGAASLSSPANNTRDVHMAFSWGGGVPNRFFRGTVDELKIYNRALSATEISGIFSAGAGGDCKLSLLLPQFAFGGGWYSALYFTNKSSSSIGFPVNFWSDTGTPLNVPSVGGSSTVVRLAPRGTAVIQAPNSGSLNQGYVSLALPDGVLGYGVFRQTVPGIPDQEAVVPLSSASSTDTTLIWDETSVATAVAIVNPSSVSTVVTITVRDLTGAVIGASAAVLPGGAKTEAYLRNLPGLEGILGKQGSAEFSVTAGNVAVLGLRFGGAAFTSIPTAQ